MILPTTLFHAVERYVFYFFEFLISLVDIVFLFRFVVVVVIVVAALAVVSHLLISPCTFVIICFFPLLPLSTCVLYILCVVSAGARLLWK